MKKNIHPTYRSVVFHDTVANQYYKVGSTIHTERTIEYEGQRYPYVALDISAASHPVYTGKQKHVMQEGRVSQFQKRFGKFSRKPNE